MISQCDHLILTIDKGHSQSMQYIFLPFNPSQQSQQFEREARFHI